MSFIGNTPTQQAFTAAVDVFSGNGSTTAFTLSRPVASVAQVQAFIENVPQSPVDAFTVSGNTITFTSAPPSGSSNIYVRYTSPITQVMQPSDGAVGTGQLAASAVTAVKVAAGQVFALNGVAFPATQVPSADANTLDDYEEGTFTPSFKFSGGTTGITYGGRYGAYTKIGNAVHFSLYVILTAKGSSTGVASVTGLPFTSIAGPSGNLYYSFSCRPQGCSGLSGGALGLMPPNDTNIEIDISGTGASGGISDTNVGNSSTFMVSGTYFTT